MLTCAQLVETFTEVTGIKATWRTALSSDCFIIGMCNGSSVAALGTIGRSHVLAPASEGLLVNH